MEKPIIAVTPLYDDALNSIWMLPMYLDGIYAAGGIPVILPLEIDKKDIASITAKFDGFLFTGGQDIEPKLYGEEKQDFCSEVNEARDALEFDIFEEVLRQGKPVLGICRGMQLINAALGGTLYQDLEMMHKSETYVLHKQQAPYHVPCHTVQVLQGTLLHSIVKTEELQVNSLHHQAVKKLSPKLEACAISKDGIVEAVFMKDKKFVLAVQWHPEFLFKKDYYSRNIFGAFVENCKP